MSKAYQIAEKLRRQYPSWPSTFGACSRDYCESGRPGRGCGPCSGCLEEDLAALTTRELAAKFHKALQEECRLFCAIKEFEDDDL